MAEIAFLIIAIALAAFLVALFWSKMSTKKFKPSIHSLWQ